MMQSKIDIALKRNKKKNPTTNESETMSLLVTEIIKVIPSIRIPPSHDFDDRAFEFVCFPVTCLTFLHVALITVLQVEGWGNTLLQYLTPAQRPQNGPAGLSQALQVARSEATNSPMSINFCNGHGNAAK